ncbi:MAG: hypothetical protein DI586_11165 [Micavibrio aeruginosavorus]|uniref:Uncharacterized protein n=1 Tax=Micavibrio aeruginosavorus TaxID=349221 RepID=A0A2W5HCX1_9BACT|nr:MAG: hypothetical protein DI586_11165 [Micavibrio aeruginosavorus]
MKTAKLIIPLIIFVISVEYSLSAAFAQNAPTASVASTGVPPKLGTLAGSLTPELLILKHIEQELKEKYRKEIYTPPAIQSLFFSGSEQTLIREARSGFNTQVPTEGLGLDDQDEEIPVFEKEQSVSEDDNRITDRKLSLGGIVFLTPDNWTIWLNKRRITAATLPKEAIDLRVYKEFIEVKWLDPVSNKIFPVRLRPNQTFSLDAQTFVPG